MPTLTINTTAAQATRVASAFGKRLNLGRDATNAEVKQQVIEFLKDAVWDQEHRDAVEAVVTNRINPT